MRVQKYVSESGVASRRSAEKLIQDGKIKINGRVAQIGDKVDPSKDKVEVNGELVVNQGDRYYVMLNKPRGFVTTVKDDKGRRCVTELVRDIPARMYPIGRLDMNSEGLLLMTNDGDFANKVMHPSFGHKKTYRVTVKPSVSEAQLVELTVGVQVDEKLAVPDKVNVLKETRDRTVLEFVLSEGRNRQIRKMCEAVGLNVIRLKRIKYGTVKLGMLRTGKWREITEDEKKSLLLSSKTVKR